MNLKYYYHLTQKIWPNNIILKPKKIFNKSDDEPNIHRICVSPTIKECLMALGSTLWYKNSIFIFRTKYKIKSSPCFGVIDSHLTNERWILKPCNFIKIGKIKPNSLPKELYLTDTGHKDFLSDQRKLSKILDNIDLEQLIQKYPY